MLSPPAPDDPIVVTRTVQLDMPAEELWALIGDGARWGDWMVDDADVHVARGSTGRVRDADVERTVRIDDVQPGATVRFRWWPSDRPDLASHVSLAVEQRERGSVLHVVETLPPANPAGVDAAASAWGVRAVSVWACGRALARV